MNFSEVMHSSGSNEAFCEGQKAIEQIFFHGYGSVIYYSDLDQDNIKGFCLDLNEYKSQLLKSMEISDISTIKKIFSDILEVFAHKKISKENAYDICCQIACFTELSLDQQWDLFKETSRADSNTFKSIRKLETHDDILNWIKKFKKDLCRFLTKANQQHEHYLIVKAKKFIYDNYMNNIGLNEVAEHLNLSPKYFSNFFKQNTGINFSDYVTEIKMSMAKRLLKETNYKVYEIANIVGYENAFYFSKVFKKNFGVTPKEFVRSQKSILV